MPDHRRTILRASAIGILVYAIVVVVYANMVPHIGIRFFLNNVEKVTKAPADIGENLPPLPVPKPGDRLVQIAGTEVDPDRSPLGTIVNTTANLRNDDKHPPTLITDVASLRGLESAVAQMGDERFVRLRFQAPAGDDRGQFDRWYRVSDAPIEQSLVSIAWLAMESLVFWFGWLVFRRRPEDDAAALFFLMCIVTVGAYMGWYHWFEIAANPALIFIFAICAMAVPQISLHFHLVAPTPKQIIQRYPRTTALLLYGIPGILQIGILWAISQMFYTFRHQLPEAGRWWESALGMMLWVYLVIGGLMFLCCIASLWHAYLYPRQPDHRDQVRWLLGGSLVAGAFISYTFFVAITDRARFLAGDATWAMFLASLAFVVAYAVSIARYHLLGLEEIIEQKGWPYLLFRVIGAICFYGLVVAVILTTPRLFTGIAQPTAGLFIASFVVLILFVLISVRSWLGGILDRRFYRERSQLDWAMRKMNEAVGRLADPTTVRHRSLVIAAGCLNARGIAFYERIPRAGFVLRELMGDSQVPNQIDATHPLISRLKTGDLLQTHPRPMLREDVVSQLLRGVGAELAQPFIFDDKLIAFLLIGPRREGIYSSAELAFLAGLADLSTIAMQSAASQQTLEKLNDDLRDRIARFSATPAPTRRSSQEQLAPPPQPANPPLAHVEALRGSGTVIGEILQTVRKVASSSATVLIRGESGTGKSLLAEVIHRNSPRTSGPFVKVHCAALSPSLLESELFGHVRGAFTGAHRDKVGRFQMADGGTLFLDEIGDISLDTQTKLLRVLQEMTFEPVGSSESIHVDVRIIAATHQPLEELIRQGRIREDLYYRLNVISMRMPSLRERRDDVPELVQHFVQTYSLQSGKKVRDVDDDAMQLLLDFDWPGNIRQLQNVIEHAVVMATDEVIRAEDLPIEIRDPVDIRAPITSSVSSQETAPTSRAPLRPAPLSAELDDIERERLANALESVRGNKSKAARMLGMPRSTLCSKLKKYGMT